MRNSLCLAVTLLLIVTLVPLTANIAEAGNAIGTWAAIKDGDNDNTTVKAAPSNSFGQRRNIWDGLRHSDAPSRVRVKSREWREILVEIGNSLDGDILARLTPTGSEVDVWVEDMDGNLITQTVKGSMVRVVGVHSSVDPFKGVGLLVLPVNDPAYNEIMLSLREYAGGVSSEWYYFYIPAWGHIEGRAIVIVSVDGIGTGFTLLDILP